MGGVGEANDGAGAGAGAESDAVTINIRRSNATKFAVQVSLESSIESFKSVLEQHCGVSAEDQLLVYKGLILKDDQTLESYGLEAGDTVHLLGDFPLDASNNTTNTSEEGAIMSGSGVSSPFTVDFSGFPVYEELQRRRIQNPNMSPEMLYRLMNNPDFILNTIRNSPDLTEVANRDPYLACIVNDPVMYRQKVENILYTEFIREMMRYVYRHAGATRAYINQMTHNPATSEMIQSLLSNLPNMNWMVNPQFHRCSISNRQLTSPKPIQRRQYRSPTPEPASGCEEKKRKQWRRQMVVVKKKRTQPSILLQHGQQQSTRDASQMGGGTVGPEQVYASQLAQLQEMGFSDTRENLEALEATAGNVQDAVDCLLKKKKLRSQVHT